ncbi:hypothetical protein [Sphingobacterium athyrii]|uniref:Uncharacterized protein n=1 Tax=Sphingobacterium athyrii TaxID=2152717 RepID=A0A363NWB9_9SPHI|nr:hypothetical protein [Sphingobacterium athyrii]PUV25112.1 hypothetical protein DCO56_09225 [Sphingobacterium athyrii]
MLIVFIENKSSSYKKNVNNVYVAPIQYNQFAKKFEYHLDDNTPLTKDHIEKYIGMIERGEIQWKKER